MYYLSSVHVKVSGHMVGKTSYYNTQYDNDNTGDLGLSEGLLTRIWSKCWLCICLQWARPRTWKLALVSVLEEEGRRTHTGPHGLSSDDSHMDSILADMRNILLQQLLVLGLYHLYVGVSREGDLMNGIVGTLCMQKTKHNFLGLHHFCF